MEDKAEPMEGVKETNVRMVTPSVSNTIINNPSHREKPLRPLFMFPSYSEAQSFANEYTDIQMALNAASSFYASAEERLDILQCQEGEIRKQRADCTRALPRTVAQNSMWGPILKTARAYIQEGIQLETKYMETCESSVDGLREHLAERRAKHRAAQYLLSQKRLPVDVWREIFLWNDHLSTKTHPSRAISHVCRFWRIVALEFPSLWVNIPTSKANPRASFNSMGTYLARTSSSPHLSLCLPHSSSWRFRLTAYDYEAWTNLQECYESTKGQEPFYTMHSLQHVDSLQLTSEDLRKDTHVHISNWALRDLSCDQILPVLHPSSALHIVKLALDLDKWPTASALTPILQITESLEELDIRCYSLSSIPVLSFERPALQKLRTLGVTLSFLYANFASLASSLFLEKITILASEILVTCSREKWQEQVAAVPTLSNSISTFEVMMEYDSCFMSNDKCLDFLRCLPAVHVIVLHAELATDLLFQLWGDDAFSLHDKELIFKDAPLKIVLLLRIVKDYSIKRLVLDHCTGLDQAQCDELKGLVGKLEVYCW